MVIDTGSELSCLHCNKTRNYNTFDPIRSTSYPPVPCSSSTCTNRTRDLTIPASCDSNKLCHATLSYAEALHATLSYAGATNRNSGFGIRVHGFNLSGEPFDPSLHIFSSRRTVFPVRSMATAAMAAIASLQMRTRE
ncbi:hypothetical protein ACFX2I_005235 [Malus domestica]